MSSILRFGNELKSLAFYKAMKRLLWNSNSKHVTNVSDTGGEKVLVEPTSSGKLVANDKSKTHFAIESPRFENLLRLIVLWKIIYLSNRVDWLESLKETM